MRDMRQIVKETTETHRIAAILEYESYRDTNFLAPDSSLRNMVKTFETECGMRPGTLVFSNLVALMAMELFKYYANEWFQMGNEKLGRKYWPEV